MPLQDLDYEELTNTLINNFNILADEVQLLSDRKTILEHKLRYSHSQVSLNIFFAITPPHVLLMMYTNSSRTKLLVAK